MKKKLWRFSKRVTVWLYRFFEAFVAFVLVVGSIGFWKLYTEPMDAKFLLPTLSSTLLPKKSGYTLSVDSAVLRAEFTDFGLLHLNMRNLQLIRPDKTIAISLPHVSLSYGLLHLLTLNYMPNRLSIRQPDIRMVIGKEGELVFCGEDQPDTVEKMGIKRSFNPPKMRDILNHLLSFNQIAITDGVLMVEDLALQQNLSIPQFELKLSRRYGFRHVATFNAVAQIADHLTDIKSKATYNRLTHNLNIELGVSPVYLSRFGRFMPVLAGVDFPVSIVLNAEFNTRKKRKNFASNLDKLQFQLKSLKNGKLSLPSPIRNTYLIQKAEINGVATDGFKNVKIGKSFAVLGGGTSADLKIDVEGMEKFVKTWDIDRLKTILRATVRDVPIEDVPKVWPEEQGTDAHVWVRKHLSKGKVPQAEFTLTFVGGELTDVFGDVRTEGVKVDYLPDMPAIEGVSAQVLLYPNQVKIIANQGHAGTVQLNHADVMFNLDKDPTWATILLELSGPLSEILEAINKQPLSLLEDVNLNFKKIAGTADVRVKLDFPLDENRIDSEILVDVQAVGEDLGIQLKGIPLRINNGKGVLSVTNEGLNVTGQIDVAEQTMNVEWTEDFTPPKGSHSTYTVRGTIEAAALKSLMPEIEEYVTGTVPVDISIKRMAPDRLLEGKTSFDLTEAKTEIYPFGITKEKGRKGTLETTFEKLVPDFSAGTGTFDYIADNNELVKGNISWGDKFTIELNEVISKTSNVSGRLEFKENSIDLIAKGDRWDLSRLMKMPIFKEAYSEKETEDSMALPKNINLDVQLQQLVINPQKAIHKLTFQGRRKNNIWNKFFVEADVGFPFVLAYNPATRSLQGNTKNIGELLSYVNVVERLDKGEVELDSKQDEKGTISGEITVKDVELKETGFLLQAVSILGIIDGIRGKNLVFSEGKVPFEISPEGIIKLKDG